MCILNTLLHSAPYGTVWEGCSNWMQMNIWIFMPLILKSVMGKSKALFIIKLQPQFCNLLHPILSQSFCQIRLSHYSDVVRTWVDAGPFVLTHYLGGMQPVQNVPACLGMQCNSQFNLLQTAEFHAACSGDKRLILPQNFVGHHTREIVPTKCPNFPFLLHVEPQACPDLKSFTLTCPESALPHTYTNPAASMATEHSAPTLIVIMSLFESLWSNLGFICNKSNDHDIVLFKKLNNWRAV